MRNFLVLSAAATLVLVTACGSDDTTSSAPADATAESSSTMADSAQPNGGTIALRDSRFDPTEVSISAGGTVSFTNNDPYDHTITSNDGSTIQYDSGELGEGETFEQTYDAPGTYEFFCQIHPTMRGTVTVG